MSDPVPGFHYSVFGLHVESDIRLPELLPAAADQPAEVTVTLGDPAAEETGEPGIFFEDDGIRVVVEDVATYRISQGSAIVVTPNPLAPEQNVRLFLLGSAFGLLLHQRGLLPLHANAVEIGGRAFAFMGKSGSGKSTLAAWFHDHGFAVAADDVSVVRFDERGRALLMPGVGRMRLWREVLDLTGRSAADYAPSFVGEDAPDKFDVPLDRGRRAAEPLPLAAVYLLERGETSGIERVSGLDAAEAIFANTYRGGYIARVGQSLSHWQASTRLVGAVPVFRAERRWGLDRLDEECRALLDHARAVA